MGEVAGAERVVDLPALHVILQPILLEGGRLNPTKFTTFEEGPSWERARSRLAIRSPSQSLPICHMTEGKD